MAMLADSYKNAADKILQTHRNLWLSHEYIAGHIGIETAPHYIWLGYYFDCSGKFVRKRQANGRYVYALRSRYVKETPWWKRVLDAIANRIV